MVDLKVSKSLKQNHFGDDLISIHLQSESERIANLEDPQADFERLYLCKFENTGESSGTRNVNRVISKTTRE